jgi:nucleoid-associated protein YejK
MSRTRDYFVALEFLKQFVGLNNMTQEEINILIKKVKLFIDKTEPKKNKFYNYIKSRIQVGDIIKLSKLTGILDATISYNIKNETTYKGRDKVLYEAFLKIESERNKLK